MRVLRDERGPLWRLRLAPEAPGGEVALRPAGVAALAAELAAAEASPSCRALVLEAEGEGFCSGLDLRLALDHEPAALERELSAFACLLFRLRASPLPCLARVEGPAIGGGLALALACDWVLASPRAAASLPEVAFGLTPGLVLPFLEERLPPQRARALALGAARLDAARALELGVFDALAASPPSLERAERRWLKEILRGRPQALAELKGEHAGPELQARLLAGAARTHAKLSDPEVRAGLQAFLQGELPPWFARPTRSEGGSP